MNKFRKRLNQTSTI